MFEDRSRPRNMFLFLFVCCFFGSVVSLFLQHGWVLQPTLSCFKNPTLSFGRVLSIRVSNNHYNKKGEERKKNRCLCSRAHFKVLLWPLKSTLAGTWLQQIDSNPICVQFHSFICSLLCKQEGKERFKKFKIKKPPKRVKWILSSAVICMSCWNVSGTRQQGRTVTMSFFLAADKRASSHSSLCTGLCGPYPLIQISIKCNVSC